MKLDFTGAPVREELDALIAELEAGSALEIRAADAMKKLARDSVRMDWLADRDNHIGAVSLPRQCIEQNIHSLRHAIDAAMDLAKSEQAG